MIKKTILAVIARSGIPGILFVIALAIIGAGGYWIYQSKTPAGNNGTESESAKKEQACIISGGTIETSLCCESAEDFPNSCLIGACGCAPAYSHEVKVCNCGIDQCFDGNRCLGTGEQDITFCTPEQRNADVCNEIYDPVCAKINIQCIKAPCDPIYQTFSNDCEACKNSIAESYTKGECAQ